MLTGDVPADASSQSDAVEHKIMRKKSQKTLMYVRKSDDVDEILEVVSGCIVYIATTLKSLPANQ